MRRLLPLAILFLLAAAPATQPSRLDHLFLPTALDEANAQIQVCTLAGNIAQDPHLKELALREIAVNQRLHNLLVDLNGGRAWDKLPNQLSMTSQQRLLHLKSLQGLDFDQAFVLDQIASHRRTVDLYTRESQEGGDRALREFARAQLPDMRDQLAIYEDLSTRKP